VNATWIGLSIVSVVGLTKFLTWYLGSKRQKRLLNEKLDSLEKKLKVALANRDTVSVSAISLELAELRKKLRDFNRE